jgi:hypothetical protein
MYIGYVPGLCDPTMHVQYGSCDNCIETEYSSDGFCIREVVESQFDEGLWDVTLRNEPVDDEPL